jgi:hypothetical protein
MFEWLEEEICAVRTPRFHLVDGPDVAQSRDDEFTGMNSASTQTEIISSKSRTPGSKRYPLSRLGSDPTRKKQHESLVGVSQAGKRGFASS